MNAEAPCDGGGYVNAEALLFSSPNSCSSSGQISIETLVAVDIAFAETVQGLRLKVPVGHGCEDSMLDVPPGEAGGCGGQERGRGGFTAGGRGLA